MAVATHSGLVTNVTTENPDPSNNLLPLGLFQMERALLLLLSYRFTIYYLITIYY